MELRGAGGGGGGGGRRDNKVVGLNHFNDGGKSKEQEWRGE